MLSKIIGILLLFGVVTLTVCQFVGLIRDIIKKIKAKKQDNGGDDCKE